MKTINSLLNNVSHRFLAGLTSFFLFGAVIDLIYFKESVIFLLVCTLVSGLAYFKKIR